MKQMVHKISAFLMALVVLFSTMSFTMHMHYCGDTLVDTSYFIEAESCGMEMPETPNTSDDCSAVKKNCCTDKQLTIEGQDELKLSLELQMEQQLFVAVFLTSYIQLFEIPEETVTSHQDYLPPPLVKKLYQLDEEYLI
jgi:hypothetical protein